MISWDMSDMAACWLLCETWLLHLLRCVTWLLRLLLCETWLLHLLSHVGCYTYCHMWPDCSIYCRVTWLLLFCMTCLFHLLSCDLCYTYCHMWFGCCTYPSYCHVTRLVRLLSCVSFLFHFLSCDLPVALTVTYDLPVAPSVMWLGCSIYCHVLLLNVAVTSLSSVSVLCNGQGPHHLLHKAFSSLASSSITIMRSIFWREGPLTPDLALI